MITEPTDAVLKIITQAFEHMEPDLDDLQENKRRIFISQASDLIQVLPWWAKSNNTCWPPGSPKSSSFRTTLGRSFCTQPTPPGMSKS